MTHSYYSPPALRPIESFLQLGQQRKMFVGQRFIITTAPSGHPLAGI